MSEFDEIDDEFLEDGGDDKGDGIVSRDMPAAKRQPSPFSEIANWTRYTHRMLLRTMAKMVRWIDFWEYEDQKGRKKILSYPKFESLLALSMADLFTELDDEKKSSILRATRSQVKDNRLHPQYETIKEAVLGVMEKLRATKGIDGWASLLEDAASQEVGYTALFAKSGREKQRALDAILDRRSAKKGRGGEGSEIHLHLPPGFLENRERSRELEASILEKKKLLASDEVIDATAVRVPDDEDE